MKPLRACVAVLCALAGSAAAQVTFPSVPSVVPSGQIPLLGNCPPPGNHPIPIQLQPLGIGTWVTGVWQKDRRPAAWVNLYNPGGDWRDNPGNLQSWWHRSPIEIPLNDRSNDHIDQNIDLLVYTSGGVIPGANQTAASIDELLVEMDRLYNQGFRRIVLRMPAGNAWGRRYPTNLGPAYGGHDVSLNQWWSMPDFKRAQLSDYYGEFQKWRRARSDLTLELYAGIPLTDYYCTLTVNAPSWGVQYGEITELSTQLLYKSPNEDPINDISPRWYSPHFLQGIPRAFDPRVQQHITQLYLSVYPWIDAGIRTIWLDGASANSAAQPYRWGFVELAYNPYFVGSGVKFGGESLPVNGTPSMPDGTLIETTRWMSLRQNFFAVGSNTQWHPNFDFNRNETELHMLVDDISNGRFSYNLFGEARTRGLVVDMMSTEPQLIEWAKRWYGMGPIRIADFDADGDVDQADRDKFEAAWTASGNHNSELIVYATGDIDDDGQITQFDYLDFLTHWRCEVGLDSCNNLPLGGTVKDYGAPNNP